MNEREDRDDQAPEAAPAGDAVMEQVHLAYSGAESKTSDEPPASEDETVEYVELVPVYNAADVSEARLVKGLLEGAEIPVALEDDASGALTEALTGARLDGTDVYVPQAYAQRAQAVLAQHGYASEFDRARANELLTEGDRALGGDAEARAHFAALLEQEPSRQTRLEVLRQIAKREGGEALLAELVRFLLESPEDDDARLIKDVALLIQEGALPRSLGEKWVWELGEAIRSDDARTRRRAAAALGKLRGFGAARLLVELLADPDESVRDEAIESLYVLADGESLGYEPDDPEDKRAAAIERWKRWLEHHRTI